MKNMAELVFIFACRGIVAGLENNALLYSAKDADYEPPHALRNLRQRDKFEFTGFGVVV